MRAIGVLAAKDLGEIARNRFTVVITLLVIVIVPILYQVLPSGVEEVITVGVVAPGLEGVFSTTSPQEGLRVVFYNETSVLRQAVLDGELSAGLVIGPDVSPAMSGNRPKVGLILSSSISREMRQAIEILTRELIGVLVGWRSKVRFEYQIVGEDMVGNRLPYRDQYKPMWVTMVLLAELISLAFLIIEETQGGAIHAILVTPVTAAEVFAAKTIVGVLIASAEGVAVLALMGQLTLHVAVFPLLLAILLGALLATGFAFLVSSLSKDVMSSFSWMMLCYLILLIPPIAVVFPSISSPLLRILPSFYLTDAFNQLLNLGGGLDDVAIDLALVSAADAAILALGVIALRRRFE